MNQQQTHWKKLHNPNYIGAYALLPNQELVLTIKTVKEETVTTAEGKNQETVIRFVEDAKPMILNVTNAKIIQKLYNTPYIEEWVGKKIQLYATKVKAFGEMVEALRIRPYVKQQEDKEIPIICEDCKKEIKPYGNMDAKKLSCYMKQKYDKHICSECATKIKESMKTEESKNA